MLVFHRRYKNVVYWLNKQFIEQDAQYTMVSVVWVVEDEKSYTCLQQDLLLLHPEKLVYMKCEVCTRSVVDDYFYAAFESWAA